MRDSKIHQTPDEGRVVTDQDVKKERRGNSSEEKFIQWSKQLVKDNSGKNTKFSFQIYKLSYLLKIMNHIISFKNYERCYFIFWIISPLDAHLINISAFVYRNDHWSKNTFRSPLPPRSDYFCLIDLWFGMTMEFQLDVRLSFFIYFLLDWFSSSFELSSEIKLGK